MARLRPYLPGDLALLVPRAEQAKEHADMLASLGLAWQPSGHAETLIDRASTIRAAAGIEPVWPGRAVAWAYFGADMKNRDWRIVLRGLRRALEASPVNRIEASCRADFAAAMRFLAALGFVNETPAGMARYAHDRTYYLFSRVRPGGEA